MRKDQAKKEEREARESRLLQAIENDDVDELHELIKEERGLLNRLSKHPFSNTPLHVAAAAGKTQVAMEMAILRPSLARQLNVEGYSSMHLALQHLNYHTARTLMTIDAKLIRVRGRRGITPLHYLAEKEGEMESELLAEFLCACKSSIKDLTSRRETAVHVAVKNNNLKAFKVLFEWLEQLNLIEILNCKDEDGNTVLHIAVSQEQIEIVQRLKEYVKMYGFNLIGLLRTESTVMKKCLLFFGNRSKEAREMVLLLAGLTASATYQAALTPLGGYWQDDSSNPLANSTVVTANSSGIAFEKPHKAGKLILSGRDLYGFAFLNSAVFLASILTIWMTAIPLFPHTFMIYGLALFIGLAYLSTLLTGISNSEAVGMLLPSLFYFILLMVGVGVPFLSWVRCQIARRQIDVTWRRVGSSLPLNDE